MRVLVTGATGFLGHAVTAALARHGHEPVAFTPGRSAITRNAVAAIRGDVLDLETVRAVVGGVDGVCHFAARTRVRDSLTNPLPYWRTNLDGTLNLCARGED